MSNQEEIWKDIPGFEGSHKVSDLGRVMSLARNGVPETIIMSLMLDRDGYQRVKLTKNGKRSYYKIHRLVISAFVGFIEGLVIDHINNIKTDNRLVNLQQITVRLNVSKDRKRTVANYTGLRFDDRNKFKKWIANIKIGSKTIRLGAFELEADASRAYQIALYEINNGLQVTSPAYKKSSQYTGVCKVKTRWRAYIGYRILGSFATEQEAYEARVAELAK